jgi:hypothetical protein
MELTIVCSEGPKSMTNVLTLLIDRYVKDIVQTSSICRLIPLHGAIGTHVGILFYFVESY